MGGNERPAETKTVLCLLDTCTWIHNSIGDSLINSSPQLSGERYLTKFVVLWDSTINGGQLKQKQFCVCTRTHNSIRDSLIDSFPPIQWRKISHKTCSWSAIYRASDGDEMDELGGNERSTETETVLCLMDICTWIDNSIGGSLISSLPQSNGESYHTKLVVSQQFLEVKFMDMEWII